MIESKKDFLRSKYNNFKTFLISVSTISPSQFESSEEIQEFMKMTEDDLVLFGINTLKPYANNLSYVSHRICDIFIIDKSNKSNVMIIENYLEMIIHLLK